MVVVVERHDTELVTVIIDEPDGNSVVGKKWNQNQSDLTTAAAILSIRNYLSHYDTNFSQNLRGKLRIMFTETIIIIAIRYY